MAKKNFEQSLEDLEKIVKELEGGDLPLEEALKRFEQGMTLSRQCSQMLDQTEQKVSQLLKDSEGHVYEKPFDSDAPSASVKERAED